MAQTPVKPRIGEHEGYSRIVFDWPARQSYSAQAQGKDKLVLDFGTEAEFSSALSSPVANNIQSLDVISKNPFKVSVSFPEGSKTRHFAAGRRVIVDVYAAPGAKPLKQEKNHAS